MMIDSVELYRLILVCGIDLESRSLECEKAKTSAPVISQRFRSVWIEFGIL